MFSKLVALSQFFLCCPSSFYVFVPYIGACYRLYTEKFFNTELPEHAAPEILRVDLTATVLYLLSLGINNFVSQIDLPTPASPESILGALTELHALQAIDEFGKLTETLGQRMAELPLAPKLGRFLLISEEVSGCVRVGVWASVRMCVCYRKENSHMIRDTSVSGIFHCLFSNFLP